MKEEKDKYIDIESQDEYKKEEPKKEKKHSINLASLFKIKESEKVNDGK